MEILMIISLAIRIYGAHLAHEVNMFEPPIIKYTKIAAALILEVVGLYYVIRYAIIKR
jgi:hypothetical protein